MKVLIVLSHSGFYRHFDTVVNALCEEGHEVKVLTKRAAKRDVDEDYVLTLLAGAARHPTGSYEFSMRKSRGLASIRLRKLRGIMDYGIYFRHQHTTSSMAPRMARLCPAPVRPLVSSRIGRRVIASDSFLALYRRLQSWLPAPRDLQAQLRREQPDVVVATPFIYRLSHDAEYVRAAAKLGIPTVASIASWDNLSTKGTFALMPDSVLVWNSGLAKEAQLIHAVPRDRLIATGAAKFDHYFEMEPSETREDFCRRIGLDPERPYLLYIGSSEQVAGDETGFVTELTDALAADPRTASVQVVVRPHPLNGEVWREYEHPGVVVFPRTGQRPDIAGPRDEYFNTLTYAAAVLGVNTSAFLEAAIADRPCMSIVSDRHREGQVERGHFQHLLKGEFIETVPDYQTTVVKLGDILAGDDPRAGLRKRFVESFVRPHGIDRPAGGAVAQAIVQTARAGRRGPEPILPAARAALPKPRGRQRRAPTEQEERSALLRLHDEHPIAVRQPLVVASQLGGNGGELLTRLLDGHSAVHAHPGRLSFAAADRWPSLDLAAGAPAWWEALGQPFAALDNVAGNGAAAGNGRHELPLLMTGTLARRVFDRCVAQWEPASQRDVLDCHVTAFFNGWLDYQGLYGEDRRWVAVAGGGLGLDPDTRTALAGDYPEGRLIVVVAEPEADGTWEQTAQSLLEARDASPEQVLVIAERDLLGRTEQTMREVAGWLGIDFQAVLARPTVNRMEAGGLQPPAAGAGGDVDGPAGALYRQLVSAAR
jgi:hypothetical protein